MTTLNILKYPDPRLYKVASEVKIFDIKIKKLCQHFYRRPVIDEITYFLRENEHDDHRKNDG